MKSSAARTSLATRINRLQVAHERAKLPEQLANFAPRPVRGAFLCLILQLRGGAAPKSHAAGRFAASAAASARSGSG